MKKINFDKSKKTLNLIIETIDDLWHLHQIIEEGDLIKGKTYRKIKLNSESEKTKIIKKTITLTILCEKQVLDDNSLRINGLVTDDIEDIPKGSYHSINIEVGSVISIKKKKWFKYVLKKLEKLFNNTESKILIISLERDFVTFAINKHDTYEIISEKKGAVEKKDYKLNLKNDFYQEVFENIKIYYERFKPKKIIIGSPAFWKDELYKKINIKEIKDKILLTTCYSHGKNSINEILKSNEVKKIIEEDNVIKEQELVEKLLKNISKNEKYSYGFESIKNAIEIGAVSILLVTSDFLKIKKKDNSFDELEELMSLVEELKGEVHIISSFHDAGRKLDGLGGAGGILRYDLKG